MKYALSAEMARALDEYTIQEAGLPSIVLMERAALCVAEKVAELVALLHRPARILAIAGTGNNGADAIAAARILCWQGVETDLLCIGDERKATKQYELQKDIARRNGTREVSDISVDAYDIIIDGIFGVGLAREVTGEYRALIERINEKRHLVVAVDIPSGLDASTGVVRGVAVRADATVTFGYHKVGMMLEPGRFYAGEVTVADIGFCPEGLRTLNPAMYFTGEDLARIPKRMTASNKGSYGRTLVIAGSEDMSGAAYLSGAAAYRSGCGLVEILTPKIHAELIRKLLPEAIVTGYEAQDALDKLRASLAKAAIVILGPGLSQCETAKLIVDTVLKEGTVPLIADADALNIMAEMASYSYQSSLILTPHIGEMVRLTGLSKQEILENSLLAAQSYAKKMDCLVVMKNAVTVVAEPDGRERTYVNTSGTPALAKGGSGDVLTGIIAGMLALKLEPFSAAAMGVYIHGICAERVVGNCSEHAMMASDLLDQIGLVMKNDYSL